MSDGLPTHPPTAAPATSARNRAPVWAIVIGLSGITYALLHIAAASGLALLMYYAVGTGPSGIQLFPNTAAQPTVLEILTFVFCALLNLLLLFGSTLILRRKRLGAVISFWWAWLYLVYVIVIVALISPMAAPDVGRASFVIVNFLWLAIEVGWPTFLIAWFWRAATNRAFDIWPEREAPCAPSMSPPAWAPPTYRGWRMVLVGMLTILMGALLGYAIMVRRGQWMGAADPNWWLQNHKAWIGMSAVAGGFLGMLTSPIVAVCLWRKNLLAALLLLYGMSAAVLLFTTTWLGYVAPPALAVILIIGGSLAIRKVLPDAIRPFRPGFCPACEHDLQGIGSERCPECGKIVRIGQSDAGTLKGSLYHYPVRKPWVLGLAGTASVVLLFITVSAYHNRSVDRLVPVTYAVAPTSSFTWPNAQGFLGHWNSGMNRLRGAMTWGRGNVCDANSVFFPAADHRDRVIEVLIAAKGAPPGAPAMQIELAYLSQSSRGSIWPYPGDPFVVCNLNAAQTRYIWNNDIPTALLDAIIAAADSADWEPLDPTTGVSTKPIVEVDPRRFFP